MTKRRSSTESIVRELEVQANETARRYLRTAAQFSDEQRRKRMDMLIEDLSDLIDESGDLDRLRSMGIEVREEEGVLRLIKGRRSMVVRPRNDMSIVVGGVIMQPDRDLPVLDCLFYDEVLKRICDWAREQERKL